MSAPAFLMNSATTIYHPNGLFAVTVVLLPDDLWERPEEPWFSFSTLWRDTPSEPWDSLKARGSEMFPFPPRTGTLGEALTTLLRTINLRLDEISANPETPPTEYGLPELPAFSTFEDFRAWVVSELRFKDTPKGPYLVHKSLVPVAPPVVAGDIARVGWDFGTFQADGKRLDVGLVTYSDGTLGFTLRAQVPGKGLLPVKLHTGPDVTGAG